MALDDFDAVLGRTFDDMRRVHASGVLVIGLAEGLSHRQLASFNLFRRGLYDPTVITFDELLGRLEILFGDSVDWKDRSKDPRRPADPRSPREVRGRMKNAEKRCGITRNELPAQGAVF